MIFQTRGLTALLAELPLGVTWIAGTVATIMSGGLREAVMTAWPTTFGV